LEQSLRVIAQENLDLQLNKKKVANYSSEYQLQDTNNNDNSNIHIKRSIRKKSSSLTGDADVIVDDSNDIYSSSDEFFDGIPFFNCFFFISLKNKFIF
jgi:hypothetical protein